MSRRNQYEMHYARIEALLQRPIGSLEVGDVIRLRASGFMDLVVEVLPRLSRDRRQGALALPLLRAERGPLPGPEMTVRLFEPGSTSMLSLVPSTGADLGRAEALSFQQAIPPIYQEVYPEPGKFYPRLRRDLNSFLGTGCGTSGLKVTSPSR